MKKLWIVTLLAVLMLTFAGMACAEEQIVLNEQKTVDITIPWEVAIYQYVPLQDGIYEFYSLPGNEDEPLYTFGYLLDEDMQVITSNNGGWESPLFRIVCQLRAGNVYYFGACSLYDDTGSFAVTLKKKDDIYVEAKNDRIFIEYNQTGAVEVEAYSINGGLRYQWYDGETLIAGATDKTYVFPALTEEKTYRCVVSDSSGKTTEAAVQVKINSGLTVNGFGGELVDYNGSATLSVTATTNYGADHLSYSWFESMEDENGEWHNVNFPEATGSMLELNNITHNRRIYCVVEDINGIKKDCWFYINLSGEVSISPVGDTDFEVTPGSSVTMTVDAASEYPISYKWYKETWDEDHYYRYLINGANEPTCTVDHNYAFCNYVCKAENSVGNTAETYFRVVMTSPFTAEYEGEKNITITPAETATLKVRALNNIGEAAYQWYHYSNTFQTNIPIEGATSAEYTVSGNNSAGEYFCRITDTATNTFKKLWFDVTVVNNFSAETITDTALMLTEGEETDLQVHASAEPDGGEIFFRWYKSEYNAYDDRFYQKELIDGERTDTLRVTADRKCYYECLIFDEYGHSKTFRFEVSIDNGFSLSATQTQFTVNIGDRVELCAVGTCADGEVIYRWSHLQSNGYRTVKLSTENVLVIDDVNADNCGNYQLLAFDSYGNSQRLFFSVQIENDLTVTTIIPDTATPVVISEGGKAVRYVFVPEESGIYRFFSEGDLDTYGYLYNAEMVEIKSNDDSGADNNFDITCELEAGKTYYFAAKLYSETDTGEFTVKLEKADPEIIPSIILDTTMPVVISEEGEVVRFVFTAKESGTYWFFSMGDPDTYGYVYNAEMAEIESDDDGGEEQNFSIMCELEAGETYYFAVGIQSSETGIFSVRLKKESPETILTIMPDVAIPVMISEGGEVVRFVFTAEESGTYLFSSLGDLDTFGCLYDANMYQIESDNDSGEENNFAITCKLEAGETYYFTARLDSITGTGEFTILLKRKIPETILTIIPDTTTPVVISEEGEIVRLVFTAEESGIYRFFSEGNLDTYGYLYNAEMAEIVNDDDSGVENNFEITCELEEGEIYNFVVRLYSETDTGEFTVKLEKADLNLQWELNNGILNISGRGPMEDYEWDTVPWSSNRESIECVVIEDGITSIGDWAFSDCFNMTQISIPSSVTRIGQYSLQGCYNLTTITILNREMNFDQSSLDHDDIRPNNLIIKGWNNSTAEAYVRDHTGCSFVSLNNQTLFLPDELTSIGNDAFTDIAALIVVIPKNVTEIVGNPFAESRVTYICGYPGSEAQVFATGYGYSFIPIDDDWIADY